MIPKLDNTVLNLGKDTERLDPNDGPRQQATVNRILEAFCAEGDDRREIQLLADEVGMGKTFVALATAYTILSILRDGSQADSLAHFGRCYRCVLVITPGGNHALAKKWDQEDEALLNRCSMDHEATSWFQSRLCRSADELLQAIRRADDLRRRSPVILIAEASIFSKRLSDPAVRFVAACLFRWWSNGLQMRERYHIVRGLSETHGSWAWADAGSWVGRGEYDIELWNWVAHERFLQASDRDRDLWDPAWERQLFNDVPVRYDEMAEAIGRYRSSQSGDTDKLESLRLLCKQVPQRRPSDQRTLQYKEWRAWFSELKDEFREIYKQLWPYLLQKHFPLVIADEAHHWRHANRTDCTNVREFIAPYARRMLLLTATPFQLHRDELMEVLKVAECMRPAIGDERVRALVDMRDKLRTAAEDGEKTGKEFSREWAALPAQIVRMGSEFELVSSGLPLSEDPRTQKIAEFWATLHGRPRSERESALANIPGPLRPFFQRAMEVHDSNRRLERAMRPLIIRHRRSTAHRRYWVGREYPPIGDSQSFRPDQSRLHLAPGKLIPPSAELVQYLLMKVVAEISRGKRRTSLGSALTGCYLTLWQSQEGQRAIKAAAAGDNRGLLRILQRLTGGGREFNRRDAEHPKVKTVVEEVLRRWEAGEKSLIFCFRLPTAETLHRLLLEGVDKKLRAARKALLATRGTSIENEDEAMQQFRRSLTAREGSGVPLFLDRVLAGWLLKLGCELPTLDDSAIDELGSLCSRAMHAGKPLFDDLGRAGRPFRPDRVFLHRAVEHVLARRLIREHWLPSATGNSTDRDITESLLQQMADENWIRSRYGSPDRLEANRNCTSRHQNTLRVQVSLRVTNCDLSKTTRSRQLSSNDCGLDRRANARASWKA
jgi:hypothetical protein